MVHIYKCKISNSEMLDTDCQVEECFEGEVLKVVSKYIVDEDDETNKVLDVPNNFNYIKVDQMFKKKDEFKVYFKKYLKKVVETLGDISAEEKKKF